MKQVEISTRAKLQIQKGSLWIFSNEFRTPMSALEKGEWVQFYNESQLIGTGYVNPHSLIAGRLCSFKAISDMDVFFTARLKEAFSKRTSLVGGGSFRLVFSESDGLPGLILDSFDTPKGRCLVAQSTTAGMDGAKNYWTAAINTLLDPVSFVVRGDSSIRHLEGLEPLLEVVRGNESELRVSRFREDGIYFAADFIGGQKTGFFLDQKMNRRQLGRLAANKSVLDLCCYSGGWGLHALAGNASNVTFVDQSEEALELVRKGAAFNDFGNERFETVRADVFDYLNQGSKKYDIIVCDPPAFAKSKKNLPQAMKAYAKLNLKALQYLNDGGLLCTCSCSYHVSEAAFEEMLTEVVQRSGRLCTVVVRGDQAPDHPWVLNRPESHYLKCFFLKVSEPPSF